MRLPSLPVFISAAALALIASAVVSFSLQEPASTPARSGSGQAAGEARSGTGAVREIASEGAAVRIRTSSYPPVSYADELATLDSQIRGEQARALKLPTAWSVPEGLAAMYMQRARLTGDYDDYARAETYLEQAFAVAKPGTGPFLARAAQNFTLHRLERVEADLERASRAVLVDDRTKASIIGLRADVAFQRGQYEEARRGFEQALALHVSYEGLFRLANYRWKLGDFEEAGRLLDRAEGLYHGSMAMPRAWFELERGQLALDRGRWDEALAHYREADARLSGWWLVQEYEVEVYNLQGRVDQAQSLYDSVLGRPQTPMVSLSDLFGSDRDPQAAASKLEAAKRMYELRMKQFPEATWGHALDHFLRQDGDMEQTVALAEKNRVLRPNGDALTKLAQAYFKAGRVEEARRVVEQVLATPWNTPMLHATAARVFQAAGEAARAGEELEKAKRLDPRVEARIGWLRVEK